MILLNITLVIRKGNQLILNTLSLFVNELLIGYIRLFRNMLTYDEGVHKKLLFWAGGGKS